MDSVDTYWADRAALEWQVELGVDEAILDAPLDRYALVVPEKPAVAVKETGPPPVPALVVRDAVADAQAVADVASDLAGLQAGLAAFEGCALKRGARSLVFAHGQPDAHVMIVGEVPDREGDRAGVPFAGQAGSLLAQMMAAIGLSVEAEAPQEALYLTAAMPWRVPGDGMPQDVDMAMLSPFLHRHIALANPDVVIVMGNTACHMLLGRAGVSRMRGTWSEALGKPVMPMVHPSVLLKTPLAKRDAWADLLAVKAKLRELS